MYHTIPKDLQFYKFCGYGFFKNLRFFDPFIILFFREMGLSFLQIGLLFSVREISVNLLEIPTGVLADTLGRRRAMIISFSAYLLSFVTFYLLGFNFWFSALAMILYAVGDTFRSGTHKAMILEYLRIQNIEHLKTDYYGRTRSCSQIGSALSSLIAATLVFYSGTYRIVFLASVLPYLIDLFLIITYPKELDGARRKEPVTWKVFFIFTKDSFREVFRNLRLRRTLMNTSLGSAAFKVSKDYLQPFLKTWALSLPLFLAVSIERRSAVLVGVAYFAIYLLSAQASRFAGEYRRRVGSTTHALNVNFLLNVFIYFLAGAGILLKMYPLSLVAFLGIFLVQNFQKPIMVGFVGEVTDSGRMATMLSVENQSRAIFVALFAPVIGYLVDSFSVGGGLIGYAVILLALFPLARVR